MIALRGRIKNGQVVLDQPADLPDDTEVIVTTGHVADDDSPMPSEEIVRVLAAMDAIEPFEMTDNERAAIDDDRQARKEWEKAHFEERAEKLRRSWE